MTTPAPVSFRSRLWRWTRRLSLLAILGTISAGAAGYFGLPVVVRLPWTRHKAEHGLSRWLGTPVQINDMTWSWRRGLTVRGYSTPSVSVDAIHLKPRYDKLVRGKLRATALLDRPEIVVSETGTAAPPVKFPRFGKRGVLLESVTIRDGSYVLEKVGGSRNVEIHGIDLQGRGRLEKRTFRLEIAALDASLNGMPVTGKGVLRVDSGGLTGELDVNEAAARESIGFQDALRAARVTIKKAPVLSEPF